MSGKPFFDANVIVYALGQDDDPRADVAQKLLMAGGVIGVQTLNEFVAVARRKLAMSWEEVFEALTAIRILCPSPAPVTVKVHELALQIAVRHGYSIYDSLIIAAAIETGCTTLYSEDLQDGKTIESLTILNPFRKTPEDHPARI